VNSEIVQVGVALAQALALLMSSAFVCYVVIILVPFLRHRKDRPGDGSAFSWHIFVPALNEELVIGDTIDYLREHFPAAHVWLIDDASEDGTGPIGQAAAWADPHVHLISRKFPEARTGKGAALNSAYRALNDWLPAGVDRSKIIIGVVDADGRPAPNCLDICAGRRLFGREDTGSVQILVRMINRNETTPFPHRNRLINALGQTLVRMQDLEFRVAISAVQQTRILCRTVGLGGNGQFTRLSALDTVADETGPWRGTLLEDYELSLHLMLAGHRNEYTPDTWVDQEGLPSLRRLVRQRTRWGQGTMQCGRYLGKLWRSKHVSPLGALEATYYLFQPWMQVLGTFIYPVPFAVFAANYLAGPAEMRSWVVSGGWMLLVLWCFFGLGPFLIMGPLYYRCCEPRLGPLRGFVLGLAYCVYILMFYVTSWRALVRIVQHRREWTKTPRNASGRVIPVPELPAPAGEIHAPKPIMGGHHS
jgi:1,2-diacylglycerol 3-beta-glucosyltransferase